MARIPVAWTPMTSKLFGHRLNAYGLDTLVWRRLDTDLGHRLDAVWPPLGHMVWTLLGHRLDTYDLDIALTLLTWTRIAWTPMT